ncbi:MAG: UDP-2,3-diacylglucosamine diphosphatase [Woeseiaceae bacterium]
MTTLFISDLHLEASKPEIGRQFLNFLEGEATEADALYILGDLFESWVGDDDPNPHYAEIKAALKTLANSGVPIFFMHGNRDFMISSQFADETGVMILDDPEYIELHGDKVMLSHGDALCIDDTQYQQVRLMTRNPEWQAMMRAKPLHERLAFAENARQQSQDYNDTVGDDIMDVNQDAVVGTFRKRDIDILLHGHTHRPAIHDVDLKGRTGRRIVLGDWFEQGSVVRWDEHGPRLESLPR